jgi:hypothetical protein
MLAAYPSPDHPRNEIIDPAKDALWHDVTVIIGSSPQNRVKLADQNRCFLPDGVGARSALAEPVGVLVGTSLGDGLQGQQIV